MVPSIYHYPIQKGICHPFRINVSYTHFITFYTMHIFTVPTLTKILEQPLLTPSINMEMFFLSLSEPRIFPLFPLSSFSSFSSGIANFFCASLFFLLTMMVSHSSSDYHSLIYISFLELRIPHPHLVSLNQPT